MRYRPACRADADRPRAPRRGAGRRRACRAWEPPPARRATRAPRWSTSGRRSRWIRCNYTANWQAALSLIDIAQEIPDDVPLAAPATRMYALAEVYARRAVAARPDDADGHFALANAVGRVALTRSKKERIRLAADDPRRGAPGHRARPAHDGAYHVLGRWHAEIMRLSGLQKFFAKNFLGARIFNEASWEVRDGEPGEGGGAESPADLPPPGPRDRLHRPAPVRRRARAARGSARLPPLDYGDEDHQRRAADLLQAIAGKEGD